VTGYRVELRAADGETVDQAWLDRDQLLALLRCWKGDSGQTVEQLLSALDLVGAVELVASDGSAGDTVAIYRDGMPTPAGSWDA
jgi:hypothetical protein